MSSIFTELKRRNVIRVALLYGLAAWIILQVAGLLFGLLELPNWAGKLVLGLLLLGFPLVLLFWWIYELTPDGIRRESQIDRSEAAAGPGVRKLNIAIVALLVLTIAIVAIDRLLPDRASVPAAKTAADSASIPPATAGRVASTASAGPSIAVLPFVDMSASRDNEYFSDGLTEELLNSLAKIRTLKVAGRPRRSRTRARTWTCGSSARLWAWRMCSRAACAKPATGCASRRNSSARRTGTTSGARPTTAT